VVEAVQVGAVAAIVAAAGDAIAAAVGADNFPNLNAKQGSVIAVPCFCFNNNYSIVFIGWQRQ
jgi:hypothetical protein